MKRLILLALLTLSSFSLRAGAEGGMFAQGQTHYLLEVGSGYAFNNDYLILGAGVNHYILDGLGVGLAYENWSGGGPGINKISPSVQYVFYQASSIKPFVGGFYRHATVAGLPAINSVGARAGVYLQSGTNSAIAVGLVQESYLNCEAAVYASCSETYPEISLTFGF